MNCPHSCVDELIKLRLKQTLKQFNELPQEQKQIRKNGLKLLTTIKELNEQNVSGKRLLLEVISRTSSLIHAPSARSIHKYMKLSHELKINHPVLHIISGMMEVLLGFILYLPSIGYSEKMIHNGIATANTGFFAHNRMKLSQEIVEFTSTALSEMKNF
jgi:hypothetical protein